jgi:WD40 repeat protein
MVNMTRALTRGEKWLFAAPLLVVAIAAASSIGPRVVHDLRGYPTELPIAPDTIVWTISLSADGSLLAASTVKEGGTRPKTNFIHLWDARTLKPVPPLTRPAGRMFDPIKKKWVWDDSTYGVALSPDAKVLAWNGILKGTTFTDMKTHRALWSTRSRFTIAPTFSADGRWVALYAEGVLRIVEVATGETVRELDQRPNAGEAIARFSPQGRTIAFPGVLREYVEWEKAPNKSGGNIELRRLSDWKVERTLPLPNTVNIAFSPDGLSLIGIGRYFAMPYSGLYDGSRLRCFDLATGRVKWEFDAHNLKQDPRLYSIHDVCYSSDSTEIAVLTSSPEVLLFDASSGHLTRTLALPISVQSRSNVLQGLAFSPDGRRLFARGSTSVLVWNLN